MTDQTPTQTATGSNIIELDGAARLMVFGGPLIQQAAKFGDRGIAMVARMRPLARTVFSYLEASGRLAREDVRTALKAAVTSGDLVDALCQLSPHQLLKATYFGQVPQGLLSVIRHGSSQTGFGTSEALLLQQWFERGSASDTERARLLTEAFAALREKSGQGVSVHLVRMVRTFSTLPDRYLELLSFRDVRTVNDVLLPFPGIAQLIYTLEHVERACGP
jgi:hypothetical protein